MLARCTELDGNHIKAHIELFKIHRNIQAAFVLRKSVTMNPHRIDLRKYFGQWLYENGKKKTFNFKFVYVIFLNIPKSKDMLCLL